MAGDESIVNDSSTAVVGIEGSNVRMMCQEWIREFELADDRGDATQFFSGSLIKISSKNDVDIVVLERTQE